MMNIVLQNTKNQETLGNYKNTDSVFDTIWSTMDPKNVRKRSFFPDALFLHLPWDSPTFSAESPIPNAQKRLFGPEVLFQRS